MVTVLVENIDGITPLIKKKKAENYLRSRENGISLLQLQTLFPGKFHIGSALLQTDSIDP